MSRQNKLKEYLKENKLRLTPARKNTLNTIISLNKPFSISDVSEQIKDKHPKASIYNAIKTLIESNIIKELSPKKIKGSFSYIAMFELN